MTKTECLMCGQPMEVVGPIVTEVISKRLHFYFQLRCESCDDTTRQYVDYPFIERIAIKTESGRWSEVTAIKQAIKEGVPFEEET